ncbi:MAG: hypothetical protein VB044_12370 [Desulfovibrio desulfuricans]|nr:hypothetical protein [Desulfovibrio desulfuricans]
MPTVCLSSDAWPFTQGDFTHVMDLEGIPKEDLNQAIDILSRYMNNFSPYSMVSLEQANEMIGAVPDRVKLALQEALASLLGMGAGANILNIPNLKAAWIIPLQAKVGKIPMPEVQ